MSQEQYNSLMSNLLKERRSLAKLREELERRRGKLCWYCKKFGHLAQNCRSKREGEKREVIPPNKFEVLSSRVMQCRVEERTIRRHEAVVVKCFKCEEKGHKCREYPLWEKKERVARVAKLQKAHQQKGPACPVKGKAQEGEGERRLRRVEEEEVACVAKPQEAQQRWRWSSVEELRKRAEEHCGRGVPEETQLLELGWCIREVVVSYLTCERCRSQRCHVEDNRGQRVISRRKWEEIK